MKRITVSHHEDAVEMRTLCERGPVMSTPEVRFELTYPEGDEQHALAALDRAYERIKRQITGMTTLVHGERTED